MTCPGFIPAGPGPCWAWSLLGLVPAGTDPIMTVGVCLSDLRACREGAPARFLVVCRDSAGEQMARGGEHVMVSIVHKGKKNW